MVIIVCYLFQPEGHREPCSKVGSLRLAKRPAGFEPGTFQFYLQGFFHVPETDKYLKDDCLINVRTLLQHLYHQLQQLH